MVPARQIFCYMKLKLDPEAMLDQLLEWMRWPVFLLAAARHQLCLTFGCAFSVDFQPLSGIAANTANARTANTNDRTIFIDLKRRISVNGLNIFSNFLEHGLNVFCFMKPRKLKRFIERYR